MFTGLVGAAAVGAGASMYAANKQKQGVDEAGRTIAGTAAEARSTLEPFVSSGTSATSRLSQLLGIGSGVSVDDQQYKDLYNQQVQALDQMHQQKYGMSIFDPRADAASREQQINAIKQSVMDQLSKSGSKPADFGSLTKPFTMDDLTNEPGYKFGLSEGEKGIDRAAAAGSGRYSGATLKALTRFNEDYAGTKYDAAFNRDASTKNQTYNFLSGTANTGENAAAQTGANTMTAGARIGDTITSGANAEAAGAVGVANAVNSGVSSYLNYNQSQNLINAVNSRGTGLTPYTMSDPSYNSVGLRVR